jgi:hypothetical protein
MNDDRTQDAVMEAVYRAPNEDTAMIIRGILESEGIPVTLKSAQIPWYDGIMVMGEGYWGDVMVAPENAQRARDIVHAYEPGAPKQSGGDPE